MRKTALPVVLSLAATGLFVVGLVALVGHSSQNPSRLVALYLTGMTVPALLSTASALVLFRVPRLTGIVIVVGVATGSVLGPLFSAAFAASLDVADGYAEPSALSGSEALFGTLALIVWSLTCGFVFFTLLALTRVSTAVRWTVIATASPVAGLILIVAFLTPLQWVAHIGVLVIALLLTPRQATRATVLSNLRGARSFAWISLGMMVAVWTPALATSIATTGTNAASVALGRGLFGSQIATIPLLVAAALLFAPRGHRAVRAALVLACAAVGVTSAILFAFPSSDGTFVPMVMVLAGLGPAVLAATIIGSRVRLPLLQQIVIIAGIVIGGACIWLIAATSAGITSAICAVLVVVLARQPSAASNFAVSSAVSK